MFYLTLVAVTVALLNVLCLVGAGTVKNEDRIVGGKEASILEFPYQVSIWEHGSHSCGGSILSETKILTAAHCIENVNPKSPNLQVSAGSNYHDKGGVVKDVKDFKMHPFYNKQTMEYDIAMLNLRSPFVFNNKINKIDLPTAAPEEGTKCTATGWGLTKAKGRDLSPKLKKTELIIWKQQTCTKKSDYKSSHIKDSMFCAKGEGTDACEGDSGGPCTIDNTLVGIISFGFDCASDKYPGVYTTVQKCLTFIKKNM